LTIKIVLNIKLTQRKKVTQQTINSQWKVAHSPIPSSKTPKHTNLRYRQHAVERQIKENKLQMKMSGTDGKPKETDLAICKKGNRSTPSKELHPK
jgi:hypothetical protein